MKKTIIDKLIEQLNKDERYSAEERKMVTAVLLSMKLEHVMENYRFERKGVYKGLAIAGASLLANKIIRSILR